MAELLKGAPVAAGLISRTAALVAALKEKGTEPCLAVVRVGEKDSDLSYERGAAKRCAETGILMKAVALPADVPAERYYEEVRSLSADPDVHGILLFRPLPKHIDEEKALSLLAPEKDVDGCTPGSLAGVFSGRGIGYPPCTAEAAMSILEYYRVPLSGKNAVVLGRSLVIGRPAAMMLLQQNATVTICHTRTVGTAEIARKADILICATGQLESVGSSYFSEDQVVIDVGIGWNEKKQKLCGDVIGEEAAACVRAYTPVPGGVGSVTTAVLLSHVAEAASRMTRP